MPPAKAKNFVCDAGHDGQALGSPIPKVCPLAFCGKPVVKSRIDGVALESLDSEDDS